MSAPHVTGMTPRALAERLVGQFEHMARRDGGTLQIVDADRSTIRLAYHPGIDPECDDDGTCVLPGSELRAMMAEALHRRAPHVELVLEVV